jgi:hypothetical protein
MPYIDVDDVLAPAGYLSAPKPTVMSCKPRGRYGKPKTEVFTFDAAKVALEEQADKTVAAIVERRARVYALCPSMLDLLDQHSVMDSRKTLSQLTPRQLCDRLSALVIAETDTRHPLQIGGNVQLLNLRAAMVYAQRLLEIQRDAS